MTRRAPAAIAPLPAPAPRSVRAFRNARDLPAADLKRGDRVTRGDGGMYAVANVAPDGVGHRVVLVPVPTTAGGVLTVLTSALTRFRTWSLRDGFGAELPMRAGDRVRFLPDTPPYARNKDVVYVVDHTSMDNCVTPPRTIAWLIDSRDADRSPSRQRRRSGYVDALDLVTD